MSAQRASFAQIRIERRMVHSLETSMQSCRTGQLPQPSWAPGPLLRSWERIQMAAGVPRRTLSLCPDCNREAVDACDQR